MKRPDAVLFIVAVLALLALFASLTPPSGDGPPGTATILPPPVLWTATPPYRLSLAEIRR